MKGCYNEILREVKTRSRGIAGLSNTELLGLILRSGKKNFDEFKVAEELTSGDGLYNNVARSTTFGELNYFADGKLTERQELSLLSAIELGKRLNGYVASDIYPKISSPGDAASYLMALLRHETHERFLVMLLNTKNRLMSVKQISEGSLTSAVVHPREVFAPAIVAHAACILVAHNHPSGDPDPSRDDRELTDALDKAGEIIGIPLMDHVVIGNGRYYSFKEHGMI